MQNVPSDLYYTDSHEWVREEADDTFTIGITEHAQEMLGDMVFVELPEVDTTVAIGEECGVLESVKAASDFYSPISGEVIAINSELNDQPELLNQDPYGAGWIIRIKPSDKSELNLLFDAEAYQAQLTEED